MSSDEAAEWPVSNPDGSVTTWQQTAEDTRAISTRNTENDLLIYDGPGGSERLIRIDYHGGKSSAHFRGPKNAEKLYMTVFHEDQQRQYHDKQGNTYKVVYSSGTVMHYTLDGRGAEYPYKEERVDGGEASTNYFEMKDGDLQLSRSVFNDQEKVYRDGRLWYVQWSDGDIQYFQENGSLGDFVPAT